MEEEGVIHIDVHNLSSFYNESHPEQEVSLQNVYSLLKYFIAEHASANFIVDKIPFVKPGKGLFLS